MRKLIVAFMLFALSASIFADDAAVLPKGVIRVYLVGAYAFFDKAYDTEWEAQDTSEIKLFNLGAALELGVTDQISLGLKWAPGTNVYSEIEGNDKAKLGGLSDFFVGAKVQVLGEKGYVKNDKMRFAVTPGFTFPLGNYDIDEEMKNYMSGDDFNYASSSKEAFGLGGRLAFDYFIMDNFFINLFSEIIYYFPVEKDPPSVQAYGLPKMEYEYGTDLYFELEPQYKLDLAEKSALTFGLPFSFDMSPDYKVEGTTVDDSGSTLIAVAPSVNYFNGESLIPWEVKLQYKAPLVGQNASATNQVIFQVKLYAKIF